MWDQSIKEKDFPFMATIANIDALAVCFVTWMARFVARTAFFLWTALRDITTQWAGLESPQHLRPNCVPAALIDNVRLYSPHLWPHNQRQSHCFSRHGAGTTRYKHLTLFPQEESQARGELPPRGSSQWAHSVSSRAGHARSREPSKRTQLFNWGILTQSPHLNNSNIWERLYKLNINSFIILTPHCGCIEGIKGSQTYAGQ